MNTHFLFDIYVAFLIVVLFTKTLIQDFEKVRLTSISVFKIADKCQYKNPV